MTTCSYSIVGGDYEHAGTASRSLKELLKTVGIDAQAVRRVMIAAYEAEMNVVIHAYRGTLIANVDDATVRVEVVDEGPGIADLALAMKEGYSTAPPQARTLGFGAGLGLPNIKKHSDSMSIASDVGKGTRVKFEIACTLVRGADIVTNSMRLRGELCRQCLQCIHACPTAALRLQRGAPHLLTHLCVECTACIEQCPSGALDIEAPDGAPPPHRPLLVPPAFLGQFPALSPSRVIRELGALGYDDVRSIGDWEDALLLAAAELAGVPLAEPVFAPVCPAVVALVQSRFPSLLEHVAPLLTPVEAAMRDMGPDAIVVVVCPSQRSALLGQGVAPQRIHTPGALRARLLPHLRGDPEPFPGLPAVPPAARAAEPAQVLRVRGLREVMRTLKDLENGLLQGLAVLELHACERGCFGSGLLRGTNRALARHKWRNAPVPSGAASTHRRETPYVARPGLRLDPDMTQAIAKLTKIDQVSRRLPGRDCGLCGAPTCRAFAEDVVLERVSKRACGYVDWTKEGTP
jgi:anti-sigma regulatory factor (Ser/Thr protein kinase)/Pyruvate/2-oxoacid:ferredoxin oxidoreductase delta subunit